jgi:hypothetical protein
MSTRLGLPICEVYILTTLTQSTTLGRLIATLFMRIVVELVVKAVQFGVLILIVLALIDVRMWDIGIFIFVELHCLRLFPRQ